jgi:hypothetical protein
MALANRKLASDLDAGVANRALTHDLDAAEALTISRKKEFPVIAGNWLITSPQNSKNYLDEFRGIFRNKSHELKIIPGQFISLYVGAPVDLT